MKTHPALAVFALAILPWVSAASEPPTPALSPLEQLKETYEAQRSLAGEPLENLATKYLEALRGLEVSSQDRGDLDTLDSATQEISRFETTRTPPAQISPNLPLSRLQKIYREHHRKGSEATGHRLDAAKREYHEALLALMRKLTEESKLEEAIEVQKLAREVAGSNLLDRGLVLHLRFEGNSERTIPDLSPLGNHGRLRENAIVKTSPGIRESYAELDGGPAFIECPHHPSLSLTTDATISLWIRAKELRDLRGIVSKYNPKNAYTLRISNRKGNPRAIFGDYGNTNIGKSTLVLDRWTHLAVTLAENKVSFYFDGALDASSERPKRVPLASSKSPLRIGSCYNGRFFKGDVDEIRIYNRALSSDEIAALFKSES